jgi:hypothetical protein
VPIVRVELPPAEIDDGLNVAVAPEGRPLALNVTFCPEPLTTVVEMVEVALWPCVAPTVLGPAAIEKSSGAITVNVTVVVWVAEAPAPVTVTGYVPAGVDALVLIVRVELLPDVTDAGLSVAVAPDGKPLALNDTVCAEPLTTVLEMVEVVLSPRIALTALGLAAIEKSSVDGEVKLYVWTSNVAPFSSMGVTVIDEPVTLTFK